jgi:glycosyltransferase involved in cell wall biosynthesis
MGAFRHLRYPLIHMEPLVTVITPAYNVGAWIGEAIDSVLAQTESRFEYLVVDDGSTDDTADVVRAKAATDNRIRLIASENRGSGSARNLGLAEATAPYVAFLDGDDRWSKHFLQSQLEVFDRAPKSVGAVFCHTRVMLEGGQVVGLRWQPAGRCDLDLLLADNCPPHNGSSLLIRRSCFTEAGTFNESLRSGVDFEMWLRIATESTTPLFWGNRRYLVDMRLMRTGSISSNRGARFEVLDNLLQTYAPKMTRLSPGLAYVRPAVFAFRDGFDDIAERWAAEAHQAGTLTLARSNYGRLLLGWSAMSRSKRERARNARSQARAGVYKGLAVVRKKLG